MRRSDRAVSAGAWVLENGHRTLLRLTGGRFPRKIMGMQTLELHTIGRKSGERRTTLLTSPIVDDDRVVLVASRGGHSEHPGWYKNLVANPDVEITIDEHTRKLRARTASASEREELWPQVVARYKGYEGYQSQTEREIPVVICEPAAGDA
ncbi:MAG TPA: nitroreductase family deazaflavin-dependent oxidoreductase [Acidimicrobiales bacterium]